MSRDDQLGRQQDDGSWGSAAGDQVEQHVGHRLAQFDGGLADRGQPGLLADRRRSVVEADDSNLVGHGDPPPIQHRQGAAGHQVVGREHAVEVGLAVEQLDHPGDAAHHGEVSVGHRPGRSTGVIERPLPAGEPIRLAGTSSGPVMVPMDRQPRSTRCAGRRRRTADIVDVDVVARPEPGHGRTSAEDQRHCRVQRRQALVGRMLGDHQGPVDGACCRYRRSSRHRLRPQPPG